MSHQPKNLGVEELKSLSEKFGKNETKFLKNRSKLFAIYLIVKLCVNK